MLRCRWATNYKCYPAKRTQCDTFWNERPAGQRRTVRIHHQWYPDRYFLIPLSLSADTQALLRAKGHSLAQTTLARVHSIVVDSQGRLTGGVDPRGDGTWLAISIRASE